MDRFKFADIPQRVGSKYSSPWITVDLRRMELFDESTFYTPDVYGWDVASFPDDMLEGFHLLALLPYLMTLSSRLDDPSAFSLNYGLDRVRFVTPIFAGDKIRAHGVVEEVKPKNGGYLILNRITAEVEGQERPGFTADFWSLVLPRVPENLSSR